MKTIRSKVTLNCSRMERVSPMDYSALVIVEMLGSLKSLRKDPDIEEFPELAALLESVSKATKKHDYSKNALLSLIKERYLKGKNSLDLLELIGNSPICFFPTDGSDVMYFSTVSQNPPQLRSDYGMETYSPTTDTATQDSESNTPAEKKRKEISPKSAVKGSSTSRPDKEDLNFSSAIVALKQKFAGLKRAHEKYFWQWRVCTEDYESYKNLLLQVDFRDRTREKVRICAEQIAFYIAEWYKREYDGNVDCDCLDAIGISSFYNQEIWENSYGKQGLRPYRTENTGINEWLYSMYVQGGFPLKYVQRSVRFAPMFDEMWGDDRKLDIISDEQLNEITQSFDGNQVVKNYLISGSLHDYYSYIRVQETVPIAESDLNREPFRSFIKKLEEGKKNYFEHYLKPVWLIYLDSHDTSLDCEFRISFGRKKDNCYIPYDCLKSWNIPHLSSISEFEIEVAVEGTRKRKSLRFSKGGYGEFPFVGWSRTNHISIPVNICEAEEVHINLIADGESYPICKPMSFDGSCQFYKTSSPYEWSSRVDHSAYSGVLFDPVRYSLADKSIETEEKTFAEGCKMLEWVRLSEEIELTDNSGGTVRYAPHNDILELSFKQIQNDVKYVNFRDIVYTQQADDEFVRSSIPLLKENGLVVRYTAFGKKQAETIPPRDYRILFKQGDSFNFKEWNSADKPLQGLVKLRVIYSKKNASVTKLVYYLPSVKPVERLPYYNKIVFGRELTSIFYPGPDGYEPVAKNDDGYPEYLDNLIDGYMPQEDTIPFVIGNPDKDFATINVYRSHFCKELYLKNEGSPLKSYDKSWKPIDIPIILRNNFEVRTIDAQGVERKVCGKEIYMKYDFNVSHPADSSSNFYSDTLNGFRYYVMANLHVPGSLGTIQLETSPAQYKFYYWSMLAGENPVLLHQTFDEETKLLRIDTGALEKNRSGIIFQSLKGVTPRHYIRPLYGEDSIIRSNGIRVKCFDVASEHEIPFIVFPCLKDIFEKLDPCTFLAGFWVELMRARGWNLKNQDFRSLHRFANEFLFDWIMIPRRLWIKHMFKDYADPSISMKNPVCRDVLSRLFRTSPNIHKDDREYLERIIDTYWNLPPYNEWKFRRSQKPENLLMQCIRGCTQDYYCFSNDLDDRIEKMRTLHNSGNLYEGIYNMMMEIKKK